MIHRVSTSVIAFFITSCVSGTQHSHHDAGGSPKSSHAIPAAEWVLVGELAKERQQAFVDVSSIRIAGDVRRAWIKWMFPIDPAHRSQDHIMYGTAFNCVKGTNRDEAEIIYYSDGTNYSDVSYGDGIDWIIPADVSVKPWLPLPTGTPWYEAMMLVCRWHKT
jgi:hypothetical protein